MKIVHVNDFEIKEGKRQSAYHCPIALAVKHAYRNKNLNYAEVAVGDKDPNILVGNKKFKQSKRIKEFVKLFDAGGTVKPFTFVMVGGYAI